MRAAAARARQRPHFLAGLFAALSSLSYPALSAFVSVQTDRDMQVSGAVADGRSHLGASRAPSKAS